MWQEAGVAVWKSLLGGQKISSPLGTYQWAARLFADIMLSCWPAISDKTVNWTRVVVFSNSLLLDEGQGKYNKSSNKLTTARENRAHDMSKLDKELLTDGSIALRVRTKQGHGTCSANMVSNPMRAFVTGQTLSFYVERHKSVIIVPWVNLAVDLLYAVIHPRFHYQ